MTAIVRAVFTSKELALMEAVITFLLMVRADHAHLASIAQ